MTDFESLVMKELSDIKSAVTASASAATAAAEVSRALEARLFTDGSGLIPTILEENKDCDAQRNHLETRVTVIEEKHKHDDLKDYIHYASAPLVVTIHTILRHFGINI